MKPTRVTARLRGLTLLLAAFALAAAPRSAARADGYRLRADALAAVQSPAGLLVLAADGAPRPWLSAEALVWLGAGGDSEADALVVAVHARTRDRRAEARLGRFVLAAGALRPVHLDGAHARARVFGRWSAEAFAGAPVVPGFGPRGYDWLVGTRVSRALGDWGSAGIGYLHQRDRGLLAAEEIGLDAGGALSDSIDAAGRVAVDLVHLGVSEAQLSTSMRRGAWRVELYGAQRSPMRLLPATSLFSVLGDVPARKLGAVVRWRAAPRLDLSANAGARAADGVGADVSLRALLRLDARGAGAISAEFVRDGLGAWTGARAALRTPLPARLSLNVELELARPDEPAGRGSLWPWLLVATSWQRAGWDAALALEAGASPEYRHRVDALARLSRRWELP
ncbi:hypothetical protein [Haliangium ochraceum]|uniref:Uncharacterized protein n=1 Tax=Haliangium ochraceum (strain DSM 14365 / JCM 11303 / SMP-2) TaxID=502025 RepID=D0LMR3_HALO1|nr:hypothetical protein [Haliangium ochraceum]ACY18750.1 hypothetical protein Hoch_6279 [Haliangium ochraceum DSM 14365]